MVRILRTLCLLMVATMLLGSYAFAASTERWDELQSTGLSSEQIIMNLFAAGDLSAAEILDIVLAAEEAKVAPDTEQALELFFKVASIKGQGAEAADAAVAKTLTTDLTLAQVRSAATAAGVDVQNQVELAIVKYYPGLDVPKAGKSQIIKPVTKSVSPAS